MAEAPQNDACVSFADYVLENYIADDAPYQPELWAAEPSLHPRSNNGAESFHSHYNSLFYHPKPHIYEVTAVIQDLQIETELKINSINKNLWKSRGSEIVMKMESIMDAYASFKAGRTSLLHYLQFVGYRCQPTKLV